MRAPKLAHYPLVPLSNCGIHHLNYYFHHHKRHSITKRELAATGVTSNEVYVHADIVQPLLWANRTFWALGWKMLVKEGYRPVALYRLIYNRMCETKGKNEADEIFNMEGMPHETGKSVDLVPIDLVTDEEIFLRGPEPGARFVDYYKNDNSPEGREFHRRQVLMISIMQHHGFRIGNKDEVWHFDFKPDTPHNYPR